jgi:RNA-directed DNA polymerase
MYEQRDFVEGGKRRVLTVPNDELKDLHRRIYSRLLRPVPVHDCVHSAPGRSIITNAKLHAGHPHLSVRDIQDCFPSITPSRIRAGLRRAGFDDGAASLVTRLTTFDNQLPQGAPTSPALLNAVFIDVDGKIESAARNAGLTYTRYVDDLFLSGGHRTADVARLIEHVLGRHKFRINPSKRFDWGPDQRHTVTKIVVNTKPTPLPEYARSLRTVIEHHRTGRVVLTAAELESVIGKVAFVASVDGELGAQLAALLGS